VNSLEQILILVEDKRFFSHCGIDPLAILRSIWVNFKRGRYAQGGSTITQQLARRLFLTSEKKLSRKIKEAYYAIGLEGLLDKRGILTLYMDSVYMGTINGQDVIGFADASQAYFGKALIDLIESEKIALVAMVKGPNLYRPNSKRGLERQGFIKSRLV
jgi:membrane peptidoglycan carboxypeptidase